MRKKFNIGVWTIGNHARNNIIPAIKKSESLILYGCFTRNIETLTDICTSLNAKQYNSSNELLRDPNIDAIYISSPNALHDSQIKECILNNKHVIVEKSAFIDLNAGEEIINLANKKKLVIFEAFMYQYHSQFEMLSNIISDIPKSDIFSCSADFGIPPLKSDDIRYSKDLAGGALNDLGAYPVSFFCNLLGYDLDLISSTYLIDEPFDVDLKGSCLYLKDNIICNGRWGLGISYKNEAEIWCKDYQIKIPRPFSKPNTLETKIIFIKNNEVFDEILIKPDNHFVRMLNKFALSISNKDLSSNTATFLQAKKLEEIRNN